MHLIRRVIYSKVKLFSPKNFKSIISRNTQSLRFYSIRSASLDTSRETVKVDFHDGSSYAYPWIFLQDNCTCSVCFHASSQSRLRKITDLDLNNAITVVETVPGSLAILCKWSDGHKAEFPEAWLWERRFTEEYELSRKTFLRDDPKFVNSSVPIPRDSFQSVLTDSKRLLNMLEKLSTMGVFILEGAKKEVGQLKTLANKIGFIRLTHYGYEFTVKSESNAVNLAYTSARLNLHTDLPYYVYPPGVQLLHCIQQYYGEDGGHSHLVDGFNVAAQMQRNYPEHYATLCNTPVEFCDVGTDYIQFNKIHHSPTFVRHPEKENILTRIAYSNQQLSSILPVKVDAVKPLYEALKTFNDLCYHSENLIQFKLNEGEVLIFDNWRVLHGREGYDPSKGSRHLEGCYIDWDEIYSRIRVIRHS